MTYLIILFLLAGAGILRLWLQQRRERSHKDSVDGFRAGLQAISTPTPQRSLRPANTSRAARPSVRPTSATKTGSSLSLDPARREAAKRRLEARRRAVHRSA